MTHRAYLNAAQLAEVTPWSVQAIQSMVKRGTLRRGVHFFQPNGRGGQVVFKWSAVVEMIERKEAEAVTTPRGVGRGVLDVEAATAALQSQLYKGQHEYAGKGTAP